MAMPLKINGACLNNTANPSSVTSAYTPIPIECAQAQTIPLARPPPNVWRTTMARLGPGDIAPRQQIANNPSHTLKLMMIPL